MYGQARTCRYLEIKVGGSFTFGLWMLRGTLKGSACSGNKTPVRSSNLPSILAHSNTDLPLAEVVDDPVDVGGDLGVDAGEARLPTLEAEGDDAHHVPVGGVHAGQH